MNIIVESAMYAVAAAGGVLVALYGPEIADKITGGKSRAEAAQRLAKEIADTAVVNATKAKAYAGETIVFTKPLVLNADGFLADALKNAEDTIERDKNAFLADAGSTVASVLSSGQ